MQFTADEMEKTVAELLNISTTLNNGVVTDLDCSCDNLRSLFKEISFGDSECDKIHSFNKRVRSLQNDTIAICDEIKKLIDIPEKTSNEQEV